jgi:hypothetical protein
MQVTIGSGVSAQRRALVSHVPVPLVGTNDPGQPMIPSPRANSKLTCPGIS